MSANNVPEGLIFSKPVSSRDASCDLLHLVLLAKPVLPPSELKGLLNLLVEPDNTYRLQKPEIRDSVKTGSEQMTIGYKDRATVS